MSEKNQNNLVGSSLTLIISGGIAAVRCYELIRALRHQGAELDVVLTDSAQDFVTATAVEGLLGKPAYIHSKTMHSKTMHSKSMAHLELVRNADAVVVAPATASILGKAANGIGDDLASTILLAGSNQTPLLFAPSMNERMWRNDAVAQNIMKLEARSNVFILPPTEGMLACGEYGVGKMAEPEQIIATLAKLLASHKPLNGKSAVVTAGATREPIDEVRFVSNHSSGKQGIAIAVELAKLGADTTLVVAAMQEPLPQARVKVQRVQTARQMYDACMERLPLDIFVGVAAVADWRPKKAKKGKLGSAMPPPLALEKTEDVLKSVSQSNKRPSLVVGFGAQMGSDDEIKTQARHKLKTKGCDWLIANDVAESPKTGFGGDAVRAWFLTKTQCDEMETQSKSALAKHLCHKIALKMGSSPSA